MDFVALLIGGLATWRLSRMIVHENGPLDIFVRMRAKFAQNQQKSGGLFDLVSCVSCTSVWIGAVTALFVAGDVFELFMYTFAFSAISVLTERLTASKS